jgi:hypothetical protein
MARTGPDLVAPSEGEVEAVETIADSAQQRGERVKYHRAQLTDNMTLRLCG